jgi:ankyrin repeat protein
MSQEHNLQEEPAIINVPILLGSRYNYPLNWACENCTASSARILLDAGADANGIAGRSPLHDAAERGEMSIMKLLLERGAEIDAPLVSSLGSKPCSFPTRYF